MKRFFLVTFLLCAVVSLASALSMRVFDSDHDLSSSLINQLYQDRNGMMWVATEDGLNRYDGNKFTIYRHVPDDTTSLFTSYVKSLAEDDAGRLYACTRKGVQIYDPTSDSFLPRMREAHGDVYGGIISYIVRRNENEYWALGNTVSRFSIEGPGAFIFRTVDDLSVTLRYIECGVADPQGNLWLARTEGAVYCITPSNVVRTYLSGNDTPSVSSMVIGRDGQLYIGTTNAGLMRFNSDKDCFETVCTATGKEIKRLFADTNGDIMLATDGDGIILYTPATGTSKPLLFGHPDTNPERKKTHCMLRDADGNLWIGLFQSGVTMIQQQPNSFSYIGHSSLDADFIGQNCVSAICGDSRGTLWVGADNDGVYGLHPDGSNVHFSGSGISSAMSLFEDHRGRMWVGTYQHGVGMFNPASGDYRRINIGEIPDRSANNCMAMAEDRNHKLWLGMLNSGLMCYDTDADRPANDFAWRDKIDLWVASLYYSAKTNALYIGTYSGLQVVSNVSMADPLVTSLLSDDVVYCIDEAPDGTIWLATSNGLVSYNPADASTIRFNSQQGLHNNTVYALRHDGKYLWLSLNSGIARFDPVSLAFTNFLVDDGLQGNEFYKNSVYRDSTGRIYFGGTGGITHFNPRDITNPGRQWTPRIAGFYLHGEPARTDEPIYAAKRFRLEPDEDSFSIEFGTRELGRPESVRFAYTIDNKDWETLPAGTNIVNFHQLDYGSHTLRVKTIDGLTQSHVMSVQIYVAAPWYVSPWAKAIYATTLLMLAWWLFRSYAQRQRHRAQLLELTHAEQVNEARLQSFVNISHEIRTPMSLVISPLQKLLAGDHDPSRRREYGLILRNAKRILRLIDELMDLRKIEKRQMRLDLRRTQLVPFIKDLCDTFTQVTTAKSIELTFDYDDEETAACVDPANFDKIMMNLLSNAVKYTPEGGAISIGLQACDGEVSICVADTGIGISDEAKEHIFERFYQAPGNTAGGTGVGLHLTHQLVVLHGGTLTVSDNPSGRGTRFTVRIPVGDIDAASALIPGAVRVAGGRALAEANAWFDVGDDTDSEGPGQRSHRILVVEDDEEIRRYLTDELGSRYYVDTCRNGREAMEHIFKKAPDLVISDIMMPVMDGLELTRAIKENINLNHIPVIVVTAMTRDEDNIKALEAGADDYVTKPFNIEVLRSKVASTIDRYSRLKTRYTGGQEHDDQIEDIQVESVDEKLMQRIMNVLNREMANPDLTVEHLASEVGLSRVHLHRRMKALTNQSPRDFIRNTRLRQAARLLREKNLSVSEVADLTGFSNAGTFATSFKRFFGTTPSAYAGEEQPVESQI